MKKTSAPPKTPERRAQDRRQRQPKTHGQLLDYAEITDNAIHGIVIHRNFKPLYANNSFAHLFGFRSAEDIMAMPLLRPLIPGDMWARIEDEYDQMVRGEKLSNIIRSRAVRHDGTEIWVSLTRRIIDWHGQPAMQWSVFDITHRVALESSLLRNEQSLRAMLEILPYPIYIASRDEGRLLFVNRKTCLLLQQSAGQLLRSKSIDFFQDPQERDNLRKLLDAVSDIRDVEVQMRTAHGRVFTAEIAAITMDYESTPAVLVALNDITQRKEMETELFHQANTDSLTGINNRRYFISLAEQELRRSRRFARPMSVMMLDIDHFKSINDKNGHAVGDAVLQGVVKRVQESLRESDQLGRLGGEEFAVILPETSLDAACEVAERTRQHLANRPIIANSPANHAVLTCTISIGVAQLTPQDGGIDDLLHRADEVLYRAKNSGRNRVEADRKTE